MKKINIKYVVIGVVAVLIIVGVFSTRSDDSVTQSAPEIDAVTTTLDFYEAWLALSRGEADRFESELYASANLSKDARKALNAARTATPDTDPITCQATVPENFRTTPLGVADTEATMLVRSQTGSEVFPYMALVTLNAVKGAWQITSIECTQGDIAPIVEFTYEKEGLLLKSVPAPYKAGEWHLVFEQDGQFGYVTPLFFTATTKCIAIDGTESVCNPASFVETASARVLGEMTETGAVVERVEFK